MSDFRVLLADVLDAAVTLIAERERAVAALRAVEWVHFQEEAAWCPWCHHFETQGHHATCGRQAALRETEGP